jgi:hypothetical protein
MTNIQLLLNVLKEGLYDIKIYNVNGAMLFQSGTIFFHEGRQSIEWSNNLYSESLYLIQIFQKNYVVNYKKYLEY